MEDACLTVKGSFFHSFGLPTKNPSPHVTHIILDRVFDTVNTHRVARTRRGGDETM